MSGKRQWVINPVLMTIQLARPYERGYATEIEATSELMQQLRERIKSDLHNHSQLSERLDSLLREEASRHD